MKEGNKARKDSNLTQLDRYFRALSDQQRRYILYYLENHRTANVEELAQYVAAQELDCPPSEVPDEKCERFHVKLHHQHLPQLEDFAIIDRDKRSGDVRFRNPSHAFDLVLSLSQLIEE